MGYLWTLDGHLAAQRTVPMMMMCGIHHIQTAEDVFELMTLKYNDDTRLN